MSTVSRPTASSFHRLAAYERHSVGEYRVEHPSNPIVTICRLGDARARPLLRAIRDRLPSATCPSVEIDWERVVDGLP
jgi:hypothetical protein